jgi:hypothetical protein
MAIGIRTSATGTDSGITPTVTAATDTSPVAGDLAIIVHCNDFYALSNMPTPTGVNLSALTAITLATADGGVNLAHIKCYWATVTTSGLVSASVTETGSHDEEKGMAVVVLFGADTTTPVDDAGNATGTTSANNVAPSVSPATNSAFLICFTNSGGGAGTASYTPPAGMAELFELHVGGLAATLATVQLTASGATGAQTFTAASAVPWAAISIAIKTAGGTAPDPGVPLQLPAPGAVSPGGILVPWGGTSFEVQAGSAVTFDGISGSVAEIRAGLTVARPLAGSGFATADSTAALSAARPLSGSSFATSESVPTLAVSRTLSGQSHATSEVVPALAVVRKLDAISGAVAELTGSLSIARPFAAIEGEVGEQTGALAAARPLDGKTSSVTELVPALRVVRALAAIEGATAEQLASLSISRILAALSGSVVELRGDLQTTSASQFTGISSSAAEQRGSLTVVRTLSGASFATADSQPTLALARMLSGQTHSAADGQAGLIVARRLAGILASVAELRGALNTAGLGLAWPLTWDAPQVIGRYTMDAPIVIERYSSGGSQVT